MLNDDESCLESTRQLLEEANYQVCTCSNPKESFVLIRNFKPDCLLLDLRMPLFDGNLFLPWLRHEFPNLPIVICSGVPDLDKNFFARFGVKHFIQKPFSHEEIFNTVECAIKERVIANRRSAA